MAQTPRSKREITHTRRNREISHTRDDILRASARAFARLGFEGTTIQDIANEAGYTPPSLYAYFKGKQEIVDALISAMKVEMVRAFEAQAPAGLSFAQRLDFLFRRLADIADKWAEARILLFELDRAGAAARSRCISDLKEDTLFSSLIVWFKNNANRDEDLGGKDPEEVCYIVRGILKGAALLGERDHFRKSPRGPIDLALQICLHGIGGPPSAERTPPVPV